VISAISITGIFSILLSVLVYVQTTNYLKGVTTSERYGRANNFNLDDEDTGDNNNNELLMKLKSASSNFSESNTYVKMPSIKRQLSRNNTVPKKEEKFDPATAIQKLQSREMRN
jgi:hypothetical protein